MAEILQQELEKFERMVLNGEIPCFAIYFIQNGLLLKSTNQKIEKEIKLPEAFMNTLNSYSYGVDVIVYRTIDYSCLKSLINAKVSVEKMIKNK
ncbi:hypothetical protein [Pontibacter sp. SGAir0037]|uniref:hypothetical protein n=1 Tax=Pontibacter sp. SGAir0037 TaxID=2571030 RepID=UPI0010CCC23F|nr:hypothetical protein [Pontibacter sp. SGAir0037]QCR22095.1 hypothetical protein C1N53_06900 [Pontibacter sp. SGAir0037]